MSDTVDNMPPAMKAIVGRPISYDELSKYWAPEFLGRLGIYPDGSSMKLPTR